MMVRGGRCGDHLGIHGVACGHGLDLDGTDHGLDTKRHPTRVAPRLCKVGKCEAVLRCLASHTPRTFWISLYLTAASYSMRCRASPHFLKRRNSSLTPAPVALDLAALFPTVNLKLYR